MANLYAQVNLEWYRTYDNGGWDQPMEVFADDSGNVYISGTSGGKGYNKTEAYDYATIKYNTSGIQQWITRYNYYHEDMVRAVSFDRNSNLYVTGTSVAIGTGTDIATIKYNSSGVQLWVSRYSGPYLDQANAIATDESGNVYITGKSDWIDTATDMITIKYNLSGTQLWANRYRIQNHSYNEGTSVSLDKFGNIFVTGVSSGSKVITIKYNSSGIQQWVSIYSNVTNGNMMPITIISDSLGNSYISGESWNNGHNDLFTLKYNPAGNQQWINIYPADMYYRNEYTDFGYPKIEKFDLSGNIYVIGEEPTNTTRKMVIIKYNPNGQILWTRNYQASTYADQPMSLAVDNSNNVYVTGNSGISSTDNFFIIKYNSTGQQQWLVRNNGLINHFVLPWSVYVDNSYKIYIIGEISLLGYDYITIKYSQVIGIHSISSEVPVEFKLFQNYPNPFNPATAIKFDLPKAGDVKITIFDITGRQVLSVSFYRNAGSDVFTFDGTPYASGLYFYKIESGGFTESKKMLLIK